jgi:hypothetical protein
LAAGIQSGTTHGQVEKDARSVEDGRTGVANFNATIANALGLPLAREFSSPSKDVYECQPLKGSFG